MEDYKREILNTRKGCLGSSDGKLVAQVALMGCVPKTAHKRLAVVKGLRDADDGFKSSAMKFGDRIEMEIFNLLSDGNPEAQSNPLWLSKRYSRKNVKLISHPDIVIEDKEHKILRVYEVKATKDDVKTTRGKYREQLFIHSALAKEYAPKGWKVKVFLVHYSTEGLDLDCEIAFDPDRLTVTPVKIGSLFDLSTSMNIIDTFLEGFTEYYEDDEVDVKYLPDNVRVKFDFIVNTLLEIKEREDTVNDFKTKLYDFLLKKDIKSIKSDFFTITRVDSSESIKPDYKAFWDDYTHKHPKTGKKMLKEYGKTQKKKGYALIKLK